MTSLVLLVQMVCSSHSQSNSLPLHFLFLGAGKSNMMDAISFVLGVQSKHLRSSRLKDLIYRPDINSPPARRAVVKLIYELSDDEHIQNLPSSSSSSHSSQKELIFSRTISSTGVSTYRLNNSEMTFESYENILQQIGVLVKARNFLVFQGDVESVASKTPQELTLLIEQICGSDLFLKEYLELKQKKEEIEEITIFSMQKKKIYETQRKEVKTQKNEAELFQNQREELEELKTELTLWKILTITTELDTALKRQTEYLGEIQNYEEEEKGMDEEMRESKGILGKLNKQIAQNDKQFAEKDKKLSSYGPQLNIAKERLKKLEKKLIEQEKGKENMLKDKRIQEETMRGLGEDILALKEAEGEIDQQLAQESATLHLVRTILLLPLRF
jgi:structural maintenance of chromosome 1